MKLVQKIRNNFKLQPDIWFFYGFLITFTLSIRKVIYFYPIQGAFNEYSAISIYLSDVFLILTLLSWIFSILYNKYIILSNNTASTPNLSTEKWWITCWEQLKNLEFSKIPSIFLKNRSTLVPSDCSTPVKLENVPRGTSDWDGTFSSGWNILKDKLLLIPLLLVVWSFLSILWSDSQIIALFKSIKLLEFFLLYIYVKHKLFHVEQFEEIENWDSLNLNCSTWNNLRNILLIITVSGLIQSLIGIWQFLIQHSIGLFWLKESLISPDVLGVAKLLIGSQKIIRAYGLFPHPNILGGFLLISILLTYFYKKYFSKCSTLVPSDVPRGTLFHVEQFQVSRGKRGTSDWGGTFWNIILAIQIIALILTFSKSAVLGLITTIIYIFINYKENVPRGTLFHVEQFKKLKYYALLSLFIFGFLLFYFKIDLYALFLKSLGERFLYLAISIKAIIAHIFWGLGQGQFVLDMQRYTSQALEAWQFQPVHNVFLLILSELGMVGLFLFVWFLLEIFGKTQSSKCSTLVPSDVPRGTLFHVEQFQVSRGKRGTSDLGGTFLVKYGLYLRAILLGLIFIMLFDHYLWDIQQGSLMLWIILGLLVAKK